MSQTMLPPNGQPVKLDPQTPAAIKAAMLQGSDPPPAQPVNPDGIPADLKARPQWICWRWERDKKGKWTKVPIHPSTGKRIDALDPANWCNFEGAWDAYEGGAEGGASGLGFVLSTGDPFTVVDLDECRDPRTGEMLDEARKIIAALNSWTEVSPSGTGVHVFVKGRLSEGCRNRQGGYEFYDRKRYFAVTGQQLPESPPQIVDRQAELIALHARIFGPSEPPPAVDASPGPDGHPAALLSDEEVITKARFARNGASFTRLWDGDCSGYDSPSEADLALCNHLAYWTDGDAAQIDRLMRRSGLMRPKWDEKHGQQTYGQMTIAKALEGRTNGYTGANGATPRTGAAAAPEVWGDLLPLISTWSPPPFPTDWLPEWLRNWVLATALATQTPPDLAGMLALAICGAGPARRIRVHVRGDWYEPTNIFTVTLLPSGNRKTAVFDAALAPIATLERELQQEMNPTIAKRIAEREVLEERIKEFKKFAAKAKDSSSYEQAKSEVEKLAEQLATMHVPPRPQLFCKDSTPEDLERLLCEHHGRMLQASDEGTPIEIILGRYSDSNPRLEVYLDGHAGGIVRYGRVGRPSGSVDRAALSVALAVQPNVLHGLAGNPVLLGRGWLARWLYSQPLSNVGNRQIAPPPVPAEVAQQYQENVKALWRLHGDDQEPAILPFSAHADQVFRDFEAWLEPRLRPGEPLARLAGWAEKLAGAVARLTGIVHLATRAGDEMPWQTSISPCTAETVIDLAKTYLIPHAQSTFGLMGTDTTIARAQQVVKWLTNSLNSLNFLKGGHALEVSQAEIHAGVWGGSLRVDEVPPVIQALVEHNYLRLKPEPVRKGRGRKPSPRYQVRPELFANLPTPSEISGNSGI